MTLYSDFPSDDNRHLILIESQLGKMKEGDSKHIEIDDRFSLFIRCDGDKRYTGWIYYVNGAMPTMTFENTTLKQLVADAYEQNIFTNETAGTIANRANINQLQTTIDNDLEKITSYEDAMLTKDMPVVPVDIPVTISKDQNIDQPSPTSHPCDTNIAIPRNAMVQDMGDGRIMIQIVKSLAEVLIEDYPDLPMSEIIDIAKSKSETFISQKIKKLMDEGYPQKQAIAIAYNMAGQSKKSKTNNAKVEKIRTNLKKLVEAHKDGDTKKVIQHHEKIDNALHSLVGEEGKTPEEKD